jgi:hypothetical protein
LGTVLEEILPAPSPLELLRAPGGETSAAAATRRAGGLQRCGGVEN